MFPKELTRRICLQLQASLDSDHFLSPHDLHLRFRGDTVRRNYMLINLWGQKVQLAKKKFGFTQNKNLVIYIFGYTHYLSA